MSSFQDEVPIYDSDGQVRQVLNKRNGKLRNRSNQETLAFDPDTGKLGMIPDENIDNRIAVGMAEDGFF